MDVPLPLPQDKELGQSETGRLGDILMVLHFTTKSYPETSLIHFSVLFSNNRHQIKDPLKAHCGPGDHVEPVITIMEPHED